jgi:hypothetical protein
LLLRKKTVLYPDGRTSYKFKNYLRGKVTVVDKSDNNRVVIAPGFKFMDKRKKQGEKGDEENKEEESKEQPEDPLEPDTND